MERTIPLHFDCSYRIILSWHSLLLMLTASSQPLLQPSKVTIQRPKPHGNKESLGKCTSELRTARQTSSVCNRIHTSHTTSLLPSIQGLSCSIPRFLGRVPRTITFPFSTSNIRASPCVEEPSSPPSSYSPSQSSQQPSSSSPSPLPAGPFRNTTSTPTVLQPSAQTGSPPSASPTNPHSTAANPP